jgi:hypothetical protein
MGKRSSGYLSGERARKIPGGSKQAVQRNATSSGGGISFREMTKQGLLLALSSATGTRAAAIERELTRRGIALPDTRTQVTRRARISEVAHDESSDEFGANADWHSKHLPDLPGYKIDALGRQRPEHSYPGRVSEVERVAVSGERIRRDAAFRSRVLEKFGAVCVICGYATHVEAAHLTPKHQLSDDRVENGVPLCPNHHWELDNGVLSAERVRSARDALASVPQEKDADSIADMAKSE